MIEQNNEWFKSWFDSDYYHILYAHRDEKEAEVFLSNLIQKLKIKQGSSILDLGCGRGRHARLLNKMGFDVTGVDISIRNIEYCRKYEKSGLKFIEGDMRQLPFRNEFDIVFLMFTSFGYFSEKENEGVIRNINLSLRSGGYFVLDYFNTGLLRVYPEEVVEKKLHGHHYSIKKFKVLHHIYKEISIDGRYTFCEKVRLYNYSELLNLLDQNGFKIENVFGDYDLRTFEEETSPRLIFVTSKVSL